MHAKKDTTRRLWFSAIAVVLLFGAASALHIYAISQDWEARRVKQPAEQRLRAAQRAARIEPWNERFEVTHVIARAQVLLGKGQVDEAYFLLLPYSKTVRGDDLFRETYRRAVDEKWILDARKAHVQHGREKKGGGLDPEDVLK